MMDHKYINHLVDMHEYKKMQKMLEPINIVHFLL